MPPLENQRHELFASHLAAGKTANQAYIDAGYKENRANAGTLKSKQHIQKRIQELSQPRIEQFSKFALTRFHVTDALLENMQKAIGRIPVKVGKAGEEHEVYVYRGDVANRAIQLAGMELGMFTQRTEIKHLTEFDKLSDVELVQILEQEAQALLEDHSAGNGGNGHGTQEGED